MTYLLAIGGCLESVTRRVDRYDPAADRWTYVGDLEGRRLNFTATVVPTVVGGLIYVCGGLDYEGDPDRGFELSDLTATNWDGALMPYPRYHHAAVSHGGRLYLLGGYSGADRESAIDVFEPVPESDGRWDRAGALPVAMAPVTAAVIDGRVWIAGELESSQWEVWSGELPSGPWTREAAFSLDRQWPAACAFEGSFYFCGGVVGTESEQTPSARVDRFDLASRSLQALPNLPTARQGAAAVGAEGRVYVMGGHTVDSAAGMPELEAFDLAEKTWRKLAPLDEGRFGICALAIEES